MANYNTYLLDKKGKTTTDLTKGDLYISVSTILKQEGKDLVGWALRTFGPEEEPLKAYYSYMDKVSDLGSRIHAYVEHDLKGTPLKDSQIQEDLLPAIESWENFKSENKIEMLASEKTVFSSRWRTAGTCDLVVKLNDKLYVGDFKTGGVYPSAFTQMAAYKSFMCDEPAKTKIKGIDDADLLVINLHRDGKPVECHTLNSYYKGRIKIEDELGVFHSLRYIWYQRNVKSKKFEAIIKNMRDVMHPLEERFKGAFSL